MDSENDIIRLGEPELFWVVTDGCIDSLVANRTSSEKRRREDDFTAREVNNRRPDRAFIAHGARPDRRCLYPAVCENLHPDHDRRPGA